MRESPDHAAPIIDAAAQPPDRPNGTALLARRRGWLERLQHLKGVVVAVAGLGALLSGLIGYWPAQRSTVAKAPLAREVGALPSAGALSLVVLPLANQTGDPQRAYIADVLTGSMAEDLSRLRGAFIVPAITSLAYRPKVTTVIQAGKDFGVRFVLHGSVQSGGNKLRVNLQLADAQSGAQLWSDSAEGEIEDLFALQDEVTARFGNSVAREMILTAARDSEYRKGKPTVQDLMLRARAMGIRPQSAAINQQMADLYRQALAEEPANADAMVGLATSIGAHLGNFGSAIEPGTRQSLYLQGQELVHRAQALDPQAPGVYAALTMYTPAENFTAYRTAALAWLARDPRNPNAHGALALSHLVAGEPLPAIAALKQAIRLDPRHASAFALLNMGRAHFMLGDNEAAIAWCQQALQANPSYTHALAYLAMAYALSGEDDRARNAVTDLLRIDPEYRFFANATLAASSTRAYRAYWESKILPAARKAGLG